MRYAFPGLADSPWATRCRPLRGLAPFALNISIAHLPSLGYHQVAITKAPTGDFDSHLSFVVEPSK